MEDPRLKRNAIEQGELLEWTARGRAWKKVEKSRVPRILLQTGLRVSLLEKRGRRNALRPVVRRVPMEFGALPEAFHGFTILHLSDLHIDGLPELAEPAAALARELEVDVCVLTGDYAYELDGPQDAVREPLRRVLSSIRSREGVVAILGNHDTTAMAGELAEMGAAVLVNEAREIRRGGESIWIAGVDDPHYYGCEDLEGTLRGIPRGAFTVLLVHTPEMVEEAAEAGVNLYLCGHTHGGQIRLPLVGPVVVNTNCARKYAWGPWHYGAMRGYTTYGLGSSVVAARFRCPPEMGLIELRAAPDRSGGTR